MILAASRATRFSLPMTRKTVIQLSRAFGIRSSPIYKGTGNFDMDEFHSAQGLRDNFAFRSRSKRLQS